MRIPVSEIIHRTGMSRLIGSRYRGRGVIFMMHSIVDNTEEHLDQTIRCSSATLERSLQWMRAEGIDIISMDTALKRLTEPNSTPFAVLTFDDGYRDNLSRALPVLERYEAPATIFVATHMVTRELDGWWLGLVPLVRDNTRIEIPAMGKAISAETLSEKVRALQEITHWVHADGARATALQAIFENYDIDIAALLDAEAMSTDELVVAAAHPLLTIGGHTTSHCFLNLQTPEIVQEEIIDNKRFLEDVTAAPVRHFAYPYGAAGPREAKFAREAGYVSAVTTRNGTIFPEHARPESCMALPRETLDEHDTNGCLDCRTSGVYRFLKSKAGQPVATF